MRAVRGQRLSLPVAAEQRASAGGKIAFKGSRRFVADRHDAGLAALSAHAQLLVTRFHVSDAQVDDLLAAQAAAVQEFEKKAITQAERIAPAR